MFVYHKTGLGDSSNPSMGMDHQEQELLKNEGLNLEKFYNYETLVSALKIHWGNLISTPLGFGGRFCKVF